MASSSASTKKPRYRYKQLKDSDEIRLIQLHPELDSELGHVRCEIYHVRLENPPPYRALSYVWGAADRDCIILTDNNKTQIPITSSLHAVLRDSCASKEFVCDMQTMEMRGRPKLENFSLFWADGICINQDDIGERNHQVTLMGEIYRRAREVVTYIGEWTKERDLGIMLGVQLQQDVHKNFPKPPHPWIQDLEKLQELGYPHHSDLRWQYLREVCRLPWPTRMWIVQESLLNENIMMQCGRLFFPWYVFGDMYTMVFRGYIPKIAITDKALLHSTVVFEDASPRDIMFNLRTYYSFGSDDRKSLSRLLSHCHGLESTDPRDKIYALTNIAKDWCALGIVPDYLYPVEKLYVDVVLRIIRLEKNLDVLACTFPRKRLKLPSWVPDWSTLQENGHLLEVSVEVLKSLYVASRNTTPRLEFDEQTSVLKVAGAFLDRIEYVTDVIGPLQFRKAPDWFNNLLKAVWSPKLELRRASSLIEALWRTLIANRAAVEGFGDDIEAPTSYSTYFNAFIRLQDGLTHVENGIDCSITPADYEKAQAFDRALTQRVACRSLCRTENGFLGLVPEGTKEGDDVCIFLGGRTPYVLRRSGIWTRFVGEAYIHGLMKGEGMKVVQQRLEKIEINA